MRHFAHVNAAGYAVMFVSSTEAPEAMDGLTCIEILTPPPPRDSTGTRFNMETGSWEDGRTLSGLKAAKWEQIKLSRAATIDAPLATPYGTFDSYAQARADIANSAQLSRESSNMGQPMNIAFTLADNTVVTLDVTAMVTVGLMLGAKVQGARAIGTTLRAQIDAATTTAELETITWPAT